MYVCIFLWSSGKKVNKNEMRTTPIDPLKNFLQLPDFESYLRHCCFIKGGRLKWGGGGVGGGTQVCNNKLFL